MAYLPLKDPLPTGSVSSEVMDALDAAMPIVPKPQNYNGPYPQAIDIDRAFRYQGVTEQVIADQYIRAARFYGGDNSAARTACFVQNHANSELVARWCSINGSKPITAEYLGISDAQPAPPTPGDSPLRNVNTALASANAALADAYAAFDELNAAVRKMPGNN